MVVLSLFLDHKPLGESDESYALTLDFIFKKIRRFMDPLEPSIHSLHTRLRALGLLKERENSSSKLE